MNFNMEEIKSMESIVRQNEIISMAIEAIRERDDDYVTMTDCRLAVMIAIVDLFGNEEMVKALGEDNIKEILVKDIEPEFNKVLEENELYKNLFQDMVYEVFDAMSRIVKEYYSIGKILKKFIDDLGNIDLEKLGNLIEENAGLLSKMGNSEEDIDQLAKDIKELISRQDA